MIAMSLISATIILSTKSTMITTKEMVKCKDQRVGNSLAISVPQVPLTTLLLRSDKTTRGHVFA